MSLLASPHSEYGVDVEGLARKVLKDELQSRGAFLNVSKQEEATAFLIATIWVLSTRYDPTRGTLSFSTYAYRIARRRVTDWYRAEYGDRRYGQAVIPETLDGHDDVSGDTDELGFDEALVSINVRALTPIGRNTLNRIARVKVERDLTIEQLAALYLYTRQEITQRLKALRVELEDLGVLTTATAA